MTAMYKKLNNTEVDNKIKEIVPNKMTVEEIVESINDHSNIVRELIESMTYKEKGIAKALEEWKRFEVYGDQKVRPIDTIRSEGYKEGRPRYSTISIYRCLDGCIEIRFKIIDTETLTNISIDSYTVDLDFDNVYDVIQTIFDGFFINFDKGRYDVHVL